MKPFSLDLALAGAPIMYRDGTRPLEWHYFEKVNAQKIATVDTNGDLRFHEKGGEWLSGANHGRDLFMAPTEKWVVLYKGADERLTWWYQFDTETEANAYAMKHPDNLIKVVKIEI